MLCVNRDLCDNVCCVSCKENETLSTAVVFVIGGRSTKQKAVSTLFDAQEKVVLGSNKRTNNGKRMSAELMSTIRIANIMKSWSKEDDCCGKIVCRTLEAALL